MGEYLPTVRPIGISIQDVFGTPGSDNSKTTQTQLKTGRRPRTDTFPRKTSGPQSHEKMLVLSRRQGAAHRGDATAPQLWTTVIAEGKVRV